MDFKNPKVRQSIMEHILFAVSAVEAAIPNKQSPSDEEKMLIEMTNALRNPIIMQVLRFTLDLDYRLKNSLLCFKEGSLDDEPKR